jgi:Protein of unknown function (DUF1700)
MTMKSTADRLVADYLKELDGELKDLPRSRRSELVDEISGHIAVARAQLEAENEVEIRNLLDRLGDPADIAAEERARSGLVPGHAGPIEIFALIGLLVGGFVFLVGWFVGLVLLWVSQAWTVREKLVGTFVVPGGLVLAFLLGTGGVGGYAETCFSEVDPATNQVVEVCEGGPSLAGQIFYVTLFAVSVVGPFFTTIFLTRRMRRPRPASYQPSPGSA